MKHKIVSVLRLAATWLLMGLLASGCAAVREIKADDKPLAYAAAERSSAELAARFSPIFLVHSARAEYNRIGAPTAKIAGGDEKIYVDVSAPAIYWEARDFSTASGEYVNFVYRVHYPETPGNLYPFMLTSGSNMGHLVVVTMDKKSGEPALVSQTHTCGCYLAIMATDNLDAGKLPADWKPGLMDVYGESLPALLTYKGVPSPRLLFEVRPGDHRVMDARVISDPQDGQAPSGAAWAEAKLRPMSDLKSLKGENGATTSLYDPSGFVKGSFKPWETLFMGWWALDLRVGSDKEYGNPDNRFYTSLKFWARKDSDMNDFPGFLKYWGWRL